MARPKQIGWDDPIPTEHKIKWIEFLREMFQMQEVPFQRCLKPNSTIGIPSLYSVMDQMRPLGRVHIFAGNYKMDPFAEG